MHEVNLRFECKQPEAVKDALEPDVKNTEDSHTELNVGEGFIDIKVKNKKLSHLKAIINSYISIISMLNEAEEKL